MLICVLRKGGRLGDVCNSEWLICVSYLCHIPNHLAAVLADLGDFAPFMLSFPCIFARLSMIWPDAMEAWSRPGGAFELPSAAAGTCYDFLFELLLRFC